MLQNAIDLVKDIVLVFGTTYNQIPLIRKIQNMGLAAWATSNGDRSLCVGVADRVLDVDTSDATTLLKIVARHRIKGLITCGSATAICTIAQINQKLGLSRHVISHQVAVDATIKENFRRILAPAGLVPRGHAVSGVDELCRKVRDLEFPIVLKPIDTGGGKGVQVVEDNAEEFVRDAFHRSVAYSPMKRLIVEEYVAGTTLGVEAITIDGTTHVLAIAEKTLAGHPNFVTTGVFFPSPRLQPWSDAIIQANNDAIAALGIAWGPTHIDMVLRQDGVPVIIDVGPRLAGGPIAATLIETATGHDLYRAAIELAIGNDTAPPANPGSPAAAVHGSHFIVRDVTGTVSALDYDRALAGRLGLKDFRLLKRPGDRVDGITTDGDRLAVFHLSAPSRARMEAKIQAIERSFRVSVTP